MSASSDHQFSVIESNFAAQACRAASQLLDRLHQYWKELNSTRRVVLFAIVAAGFSIWLLSEWVCERVKNQVLHHSAASTAFVLAGIIEPLAQNLATGSEISPDARETLDAWRKARFGEHIVTIRIWRTDGTLAYANNYEPAPGSQAGLSQQRLLPSLNGDITAELIEPRDGGYTPASTGALLALFAPIRTDSDERVIAVAEIHEVAAGLINDLQAIRYQSWTIAGALIISLIGLLIVMIRRNGRIIDSQQATLDRQRGEIDRMRTEVDRQRGEINRIRGFNKKLRLKLTEFHTTVAARHEKFLRQVGADLHDGPAQHVAFALLRIDALRPALAAAKIKSTELERLRTVLEQSHQEIRSAIRGLFLPRELEEATAAETIQLAVQNHERRTKTKVRCVIGKMPEYVSPKLQLCIYRFVQEGLANAFRHAAGKDQQLRIQCDGVRIDMEIADKGPGCSQEAIQAGEGLGIICLKNRVESLGGIFVIESDPNSGTRLRSTLFIAKMGVKFGYSDSRGHR